MRGQDREPHAELRHDVQRLQIHRRFRQPHAFRRAAEAESKILDAPVDLRVLVAGVRQRHDHVVVALRDAPSRGRRISRGSPDRLSTIMLCRPGALSFAHASNVGPKLKLIRL